MEHHKHGKTEACNVRTGHALPPTPPLTDETTSEKSATEDSIDYPLPPPTTIPTKVLDLDLKTPDAHVPRDPRLIRLTGIHPFNVEAPLTELFNEGFLTSPELFFVRNHGLVPQVLDEEVLDWEFTVEGLVETPMTISLKTLISDFDQVTRPITLVCAGNRRKEQNMVRKSKGFNWGAAGLSTALFTGVVMSDVIRKAKPKRGAKYVCMEGADNLPNGFYGTSVRLSWVMDPNRGFMLAYKMNGEMLRLDHGRPLRVVIPGQIGGRSVKWLKRLIVTDKPSDNWYHIYDNRVLPTMISPEEAAEDPKWWTDERYAIFDLSPNSATCYPRHDEQLCLTDGGNFYTARGYAYSGGGRRVTRVEISLDKGRSWRLTHIDYAEDKYREAEGELFGGRLDMSWRETCFCWCFWSIELAVSELANAEDILVRAMDESMNMQPRDMYWSVLGMMNNPWFRVAIIHEGDCLRFEHPTQPALMAGGWMERVKKEGGDLTNGFWGENSEHQMSLVSPAEPVTEIPMVKKGLTKSITFEEFRKHDNEDSPWFVVDGEVYDGSAFLEGHPGGAQSIISAAGQDSTDEFLAIHSETAKAMMPTYHIGTLNDTARSRLAEPGREAAIFTDQSFFLQPKSWMKAVLYEKEIVSWDSRTFRFKLEHEKQKLGLPIGQHLLVRLKDPVTKQVPIRSYTPISETNDEGFMDLLIKVYFPTDGKTGGKMSQAMDALTIGQTIEVKGPLGRFEYCGRGKCLVSGKEKSVKSFVMICGGSGITPIYQVFRAVMNDEEDKTKCTMFDSNRLLEDILCKADLDRLSASNKHKCRIFHTLTNAPGDWQGRRGRITSRLVRDHCVRDDKTLVLICGPEAMERSIRTALLQAGWRDDQLHVF